MGSFVTFLACAVTGAMELIAALVLFFMANSGRIRILSAGLLFPPLEAGLMCLYYPLVSFLARGENRSYLAGDEGWAPLLGSAVMMGFTALIVLLFELLLILKHWERKSRVSTPADDSDDQVT